MKIVILGTRGIPNNYSGFEQFAEFFSVFLVEQGHDVWVYNSHNHVFQEKKFRGVNIIHKFDPEYKVGTFGQFIYDFNCIIDSRKRSFDVILQLGYTSNTIWHRFLPKKPIIISNMDGLEWKRSKYSTVVRRFLKYAEKLAVKSSDYLISDSIGIQNYLLREYNVSSEFIAYGAELFNEPNREILKQYNVEEFKYNMLVARFEPENNLEMILDGVVLADKKNPFLVVGRHDSNKFGEYLKNKFKDAKNIRFVGGIFNLEYLNNLRYFSNLYFHGHSVGGTNPSLLEAMASKALIVAHNNEFSKSILEGDAFYFKNKEEVKIHIDTIDKNQNIGNIENCYAKINSKYRWEVINNKYLDLFIKSVKRDK
ncbi:DUF1972 domain-containing protein [Algibacter agarivorans]|uniref:DUF1972 domain-containing protein n=1 Tax=Algibacter agarivorans TaxID=1109741 RepID=A0ABP9GGK9_9FLAO